jgi:hypothetical protein
VWENEPSHSQGNFHLRSWNPSGFLIIKSLESTRFPCVQVACDTIEKLLTRATTLLQLSSQSEVYMQKLWGPKITKLPTLGILRLPFGSLETKCHLDVGLVEKYKVYYKGKGGGFPQVWVVMNFVSLTCSRFILTPKVLQLCTNHLAFGFLQVHVNSWCLSLFLVPSQSSSMPLYPQSVASQGVCPDSLFFRCF